MTVATDQSADRVIDQSAVLREQLGATVDELARLVEDLNAAVIARRTPARGETSE